MDLPARFMSRLRSAVAVVRDAAWTRGLRPRLARLLFGTTDAAEFARKAAEAERALAEALAEGRPPSAVSGSTRYQWKSLLGGRFTTGKGPLTELFRSWWDTIATWSPRPGDPMLRIDGSPSPLRFPPAAQLREAMGLPDDAFVDGWEIVRVDGAGRDPVVVATVRGSETDARAARDDMRAAALRESVFPPELAQLDPPSSNAPDWQYRQMGGRGERDLLPLTHIRQLQIAFFLSIQNPIANRAIGIKTEFVVGSGFRYKAKHPDVQKVLDRFWKVNDLERKQRAIVRESCLFGEIIRLADVEPQTGTVRVKYVDPLQCVQVVTDPYDVEVARRLILASRFESTDRNVADVIRPADNLASERFGRRSGQAFFHKFNSVSNATRGHSDLLCVLDWVDALDQFMFGQVDRALLLQSFIWDVKLEGLDEAKIRKWLSEQPGVPQPGSIRAHNEKVTWTPLAPDLKANDASALGQMIRLQVVGGIGLADWMFGTGVATQPGAREMTSVTMKMMEARQGEIVDVFTDWAEFAIDRALDAGTLRETEDFDRTFTVVRPLLTQRDLAQVAASVNTVAQFLSVAQGNGWINEDQAATIFVTMVDQLGFDFVAEREAERAEIAEEGGDPAEAGREQVRRNAAANAPAEGTGSEAGRSVDPRTGNPPDPRANRMPTTAGKVRTNVERGVDPGARPDGGWRGRWAGRGGAKPSRVAESATTSEIADALRGRAAGVAAGNVGAAVAETAASAPGGIPDIPDADGSGLS